MSATLAIEAAARSSLYRLCALGMAYPNGARWEAVSSRTLTRVARLGWTHPVDRLVEGLVAAWAPPDELAPHHLLLFPPIASQDVPHYETAYRGEDVFRQVNLIADVAAFYRAHGVVVGGPERERPDHITVELEFMALAAQKEAYALTRRQPDEATMCRESQALFLRDHLACWAPGFGRRAARVATHPWYGRLGELVTEWVELDAELLGVEPAEVVDRPLPPPPPEDGVCGPCPAPSGECVT